MIGDRWGVSDERGGAALPVRRLRHGAGAFGLAGRHRASARPRQLWPWVAQIRLGPYSYDWIDNLGRRSPQELRGLPEPEPGENFTSALAGRPLGRILSVSPQEQLTAWIAGAVMSYVLVPQRRHDPAAAEDRAWPAAGCVAPLVSVGDLVMARRQLLNLKRLAEQPPADA